MSEYRVEYGGGEWNVLTAERPYLLQATCPDQARAERIARALAVLDAMDEHYAGEAAAQAASDDDVRRCDE